MQQPFDPADLFDSPRGRLVAAAMLGASMFTAMDILVAYIDHKEEQRRFKALAAERDTSAIAGRRVATDVEASPVDGGRFLESDPTRLGDPHDASHLVNTTIHLDQECARVEA